MENFLFFFPFYHLDVLKQLKGNNLDPNQLKYLIDLITYPNSNQDDFSAIQYHHKATVETLSDHINY